jgi:hypothetical protein
MRWNSSISSTVAASCLLLAVIWNYITMHGHINMEYETYVHNDLLPNVSPKHVAIFREAKYKVQIHGIYISEV